MADESLTPRDNLYRFIPRTTHGRGRVGVRLTGVGIPENPPVSRETKEQLINFHISSINAMLRAQGRPELSPADYAKVHAAAQLSPNQSSESILQTVLAAATATVPASNVPDAVKQHLAANGADEASLHAAIGRFGSSLGFAALLAAARDIRNGVEPSGNMSNGVGNTGGTYPGYGGTPFTSERSMYSYASTNYAINRDVSNQLYNMGIRSSAQVQQVVNDVGRIGLGSGKENPRFTNNVAPHVARLRIAEGANTTPVLDHVRRHAEQYRKIKEEQLRAEQSGNADALAAANRKMEEFRRDSRPQDTARTPEGRIHTGKIVTETEREVDAVLRQQGPQPAPVADQQRAIQAPLDRAGSGLERALIDRSRAEVDAQLRKEHRAENPPVVRPDAIAGRADLTEQVRRELVAAEPRRITTDQATRRIAAADDEFGATPPATPAVPTNRAEVVPAAPTTVAAVEPPKPDPAKAEPAATDKKPDPVKTAAVAPAKPKAPTV